MILLKLVNLTQIYIDQLLSVQAPGTRRLVKIHNRHPMDIFVNWTFEVEKIISFTFWGLCASRTKSFTKASFNLILCSNSINCSHSWEIAFIELTFKSMFRSLNEQFYGCFINTTYLNCLIWDVLIPILSTCTFYVSSKEMVFLNP